MRHLLIAALGMMDDSRCCCDACTDLHGYVARWLRDHARKTYARDGGQMQEQTVSTKAVLG